MKWFVALFSVFALAASANACDFAAVSFRSQAVIVQPFVSSFQLQVAVPVVQQFVSVPVVQRVVQRQVVQQVVQQQVFVERQFIRRRPFLELRIGR